MSGKTPGYIPPSISECSLVGYEGRPEMGCRPAIESRAQRSGAPSAQPRCAKNQFRWPKCPLRVVDDQTTAIRELTLCVSMHPFAVCQRWQFPSSAHFHPWSGRILRPQRGGSPPWFGLHADNFGGLPLEQLPRRSGTIGVTGGCGEACG